MLHRMDATHYPTHPAHGRAILDILYGIVSSLYKIQSDDPLIFAEQILDRMPDSAALLIRLRQWANAVHEATPDQITDKGAQICP